MSMVSEASVESSDDDNVVSEEPIIKTMAKMSRKGLPSTKTNSPGNPMPASRSTKPGGKFRPLSDVTGVCHCCKDQIEWKRKYGKYKPLTEPAKCQRCSKRAVRQAYHNLCTGRNFKYSWICVIFCSSQKASRFELRFQILLSKACEESIKISGL
ncbi:hypothetical protein LOK49_Contig302G00004 [Camellia lanceoleosa]|nr:hypothetical protein LOK49_Contig302G00004 [Camellia lanceoleosa]